MDHVDVHTRDSILYVKFQRTRRLYFSSGLQEEYVVDIDCLALLLEQFSNVHMIDIIAGPDPTFRASVSFTGCCGISVGSPKACLLVVHSTKTPKWKLPPTKVLPGQNECQPHIKPPHIWDGNFRSQA